MKSFSDDLACIGNQNKCFGFVFFDEVAELYSLRTIQRSKDDVFVFSGKCALCLADCGAPVQFMGQKITDRFRVVADNVEILGKVETFDERVDHKRTDRKPEERIKPSFDIEDKTSGDRDQNIGDEKRPANIKTGIFFQDHCNDVGAAAGRSDIKQNCGTKRRKCDRKAEFEHRLIGERVRHWKNPFQCGECD